MKLEFAGAILDGTISPSDMRSRDKAIADARRLYGKGVVTLDRAGFIIFDNVKSGQEAAKKMMGTVFKKYNIKEMVPRYAISDGSGKAAKETYIKYIEKHMVDRIKKYKFDVTKKIKDYS